MALTLMLRPVTLNGSLWKLCMFKNSHHSCTFWTCGRGQGRLPSNKSSEMCLRPQDSSIQLLPIKPPNCLSLAYGYECAFAICMRNLRTATRKPTGPQPCLAIIIAERTHAHNFYALIDAYTVPICTTICPSINYMQLHAFRLVFMETEWYPSKGSPLDISVSGVQLAHPRLARYVDVLLRGDIGNTTVLESQIKMVASKVLGLVTTRL